MGTLSSEAGVFFPVLSVIPVNPTAVGLRHTEPKLLLRKNEFGGNSATTISLELSKRHIFLSEFDRPSLNTYYVGSEKTKMNT